MEGTLMIVEVDTIASFFGIDSERAQQSAVALAKKAKKGLARAVPAPLRQPAAMSLVAAGSALLDSPMASILGDAWGTARDLHRFCDQSAYPPDRISEHTLSEHEIALTRNPELEVVLDGAPTGLKLQFELKLALTVMSAVLRIQAGRIIGARVGDCRGGGKYSCSSVTLAERKTGKFRIPGAVSFDPGVPLGKPYGHAH
jgi:hypothetical protein